MPPPIFPVALVNDFSIEFKKVPTWAVRRQVSVDNRQLRVLDAPLPIWMFTLSTAFLPDGSDQRSSPGSNMNGRTDLRNLMGFFASLQGGFSEFYITDPTDNNVVGQDLGIGNGTNTAFQFVRTLGIGSNIFNEPIYGLNTNFTINIYVNGVLKTNVTDYALNVNTGVVTFVIPPGNGLLVTADFHYYFLVNFDDDSMDFNYFLYQLWEIKEVKLRSQLL